MKSELESSLDECKSLQKTLEDTRSKILDLVEDLEKTKQQAGSKEEELIELRDEVKKQLLLSIAIALKLFDIYKPLGTCAVHLDVCVHAVRLNENRLVGV